MRINKWLALHTHVSRRKADEVIQTGTVRINNAVASIGDRVEPSDTITIDGRPVVQRELTTELWAFHKPRGVVCSHNGQGNKTIYECLPFQLQNFIPIGRLDKETTGLLLLTNDGELANQLMHPRFEKRKTYKVKLSKKLTANDHDLITGKGVRLSDGLSRFTLQPLQNDVYDWRITMHEGRNRQIRRTFDALGYRVLKLHRESVGPYKLDDLKPGQLKKLLLDNNS